MTENRHDALDSLYRRQGDLLTEIMNLETEIINEMDRNKFETLTNKTLELDGVQQQIRNGVVESTKRKSIIAKLLRK